MSQIAEATGMVVRIDAQHERTMRQL